MAVGTAILAASLVIAIEVIRDDRADRLATQNKKLRQEVARLTEVVDDSNERIRQLEKALEEADIPLPGGDAGQTNPSQQPGAASTQGPAAP